MTNKKLRAYLAGQALLAVMQEAQEMKTATFSDWVKHILMGLGLSFLNVNYIEVPGVYQDAAKRAVKYADAVASEMEKECIEPPEIVDLPERKPAYQNWWKILATIIVLGGLFGGSILKLILTIKK